MSDGCIPSPPITSSTNCACLRISDMFLTTCLSETPSSILMWSHYAMNHTGFCVEYDFNNLSAENHYILEHLEKVNYTDQLPSLPLASLIQVMRKKLDPTFKKDPKITEATTETPTEEATSRNYSAFVI